MEKAILDKIINISKEKDLVLVAIEGRCASGKTTYSEKLKAMLTEEGFPASLIHIDDFFLRPEQRTKERLETPGENIDHERFLEKVLIPIKEKREVKYRPFDCSLFALGEEKCFFAEKIIIVEGSYSLNKNLFDFYDVRIFLTAPKEIRIERIRKRNGEKMLQNFLQRWIPMEELYFKTFNTEEKCDFIINNGD